jgi:hypothetical protein
MDFCSLENFNKKSHFNVVLFSTGHSSRKNYVVARTPLFKEELFKWLFLFFCFDIIFEFSLLKKKNLLGKRKIGWPLEFPYYLNGKKNV